MKKKNAGDLTTGDRFHRVVWEGDNCAKVTLTVTGPLRRYKHRITGIPEVIIPVSVSEPTLMEGDSFPDSVQEAVDAGTGNIIYGSALELSLLG